MATTIEQQVALDEALVPSAQRSPFFKAFLVTADVPEIYMKEFWATAYVHQHSIRFKMDTRKNIVDLEAFREMLHISPRVPGQSFAELPFEEEILEFLRRNIDYAFLIWEDFVYQVDHKNQKKSHEMYYPRFTKVIIHHFMTKKPSIPRRNKVNWHYARDDILFSTIKVAYKEYYAYATGEETPKPKASARRKRGGSASSTTPPTPISTPTLITIVMATPRLTAAAKGKQPARATSLTDPLDVERTKAEQLKIVLRRSRQETYISQQGASSTDEGTGSKPWVPNVPSDDSEEEILWNSFDDEDVDDQTKGRDDNEGEKTDESDDDDDDQDKAEKVNDNNDDEEEISKIDEQEATESGEGDDEETESDRENVPEIYMQELWATAYVHQHSIRFKMDTKKNIVDLEAFREMLHISPRVLGQSFDELPFEEEILEFLRFLGHSAQIKTLTYVNVNKLFQPWRSFAADVDDQAKGRDDNEGKKTDESDANDDDQDDNEKDNDDDDDEEEISKIDEQEATESGEGNDEETKSDRGSEEEETREEAEESFDPISRTPEDCEDDGNGEEDQGLRISEEESIHEEEEADELYRNVDINQGRGLQVSQDIEDSHVTLTPVYSDGQQESLSTSSFMTSLLNPIIDPGMESIFTTASSFVAPLPSPTSIMTPSIITTTITASQPPIPPTPIPSEFLQNLPTFESVFRFEDRVKSLEVNFLEFMRTNQSLEAVSNILGREHASASTPSEPATRSVGRSTTGTQSRQLFASESTFAEEPVQTTYTPIDFSNFIMNRLGVDTLTPELLAGPTYELMSGSCNSLTELEYHLEEVYKATTNQLDWVNLKGQQNPHNLLQPLPLIPDNRGHRVIPFEHFINNDLEYLRRGASSQKYTTSVTKTKAADYGNIKWIEDLVPRDFKRLRLQDIEDMLLLLVQGKLSNLTIKERFAFNVSLRMFTRSIVIQRRVEDLQLGVESYQKRLNLTKPDTYRSNLKRREAYTAYSYPRGFIYQNKDKKNRLRLQDIEDMLLLLVQGKLSNLTVEERFAFNVSLRMFTRSIVIQRRVEDLQLGVERYQKRLNLTNPDTYRSNLKRREAYTAYSYPRGFIYQNKDKKNRLMRIDELHKFSDGMLNDVRNALGDRLKGIRMQYLPTTIWRKGDKDRAAAMIKAIDKMLKTRRIMRSLERFVGGRQYERDFRMLQRTI
nr:hypothetical protein [Tanacetum cinerariifolium]